MLNKLLHICYWNLAPTILSIHLHASQIMRTHRIFPPSCSQSPVSGKAVSYFSSTTPWHYNLEFTGVLTGPAMHLHYSPSLTLAPLVAISCQGFRLVNWFLGFSTTPFSCSRLEGWPNKATQRGASFKMDKWGRNGLAEILIILVSSLGRVSGL